MAHLFLIFCIYRVFSLKVSTVSITIGGTIKSRSQQLYRVLKKCPILYVLIIVIKTNRKSIISEIQPVLYPMKQTTL